MLPPPTLSFTIPSVHDNVVLQCRIYHPKCLVPNTISELGCWTKRGAVVAHPYAPLGGSYDDPVVDLVASTILNRGYVVGTFNFRGAGASSTGRTSWQSKPEQNDYISFIGLIIFYLHHLSDPVSSIYGVNPPRLTRSNPDLNDLDPIQSQAIFSSHREYDTQFLTTTTSNPPAGSAKDLANSKSLPSLILAGYSYGALITSRLPPMLSSIINPFQSPPPGTAHAEIRLRATSLALQQNKLMKSRVYSLLTEAHTRGRSVQVENHILHSPKRRNATGNVRMGGDEDLRRSSHESHRPHSSFTIDTPERVRRSVDKIRAMSKNNRFSPCDLDSQPPLASYRKKQCDSQISLDFVSPNHSKDELGTIEAVSGLAEDLQVAYVLVSPLHGWISALATMGSLAKEKATLTEQEMKLTVDRTLAVFGDDDIFVSVKKLRTWVKKIEGATKVGEECHFRHREVPGAGHFWHDRQAVMVLREEIDDFVRTLSA